MLDIKAQLARAGEDVADTAFSDPHDFPFVVFIDKAEVGGSDFYGDITYHNLTVERYSYDGEENNALRDIITGFNPHYEKEKIWLADLSCFMEIYTFELFERR